MSRISGILKRRVAYPFLKHFAPERLARVNGFQLRVNLRDRIIGSDIWHGINQDADILSFISRLDITDKVCVDVGANIGLYSLAMSEQAAKVFAFEPEPYNFKLLSENIALNHRTNVIPKMCALGDIEGESFLTLNPDNFGMHHISQSGLKVPVTTADLALQDTPDNSIALIKMDVEGYECRVLEGMSQTLARNPDVILLVEIFPIGLRQVGDSATKLVNMLKELGFDGFEFYPHRLIPFLDAHWYETDSKSANVALARDPARLKREAVILCKN